MDFRPRTTCQRPPRSINCRFTAHQAMNGDLGHAANIERPDQNSLCVPSTIVSPGLECARMTRLEVHCARHTEFYGPPWLDRPLIVAA
jgi:hypothetical protein